MHQKLSQNLIFQLFIKINSIIFAHKSAHSFYFQFVLTTLSGLAANVLTFYVSLRVILKNEATFNNYFVFIFSQYKNLIISIPISLAVYISSNIDKIVGI
jgi:hypothetical protein